MTVKELKERLELLKDETMVLWGDCSPTGWANIETELGRGAIYIKPERK